ncbi:flippase [Kaistella solincola]|uniref:Flippase n=1 Tax=Kaistella solincola TaxID=510955 RepID=A0ABR4ZPJ7_9FLAO|nr:O-antigen translocase [Kaistella solincola]KIA82898.1 flippase [Kaistella solincola]
MIKKAKNLLQTDLVKVFSLTGLSTVIKLLTSYITVKVVAALVGPGGIALIGQLQNCTAIFTTFGSGGINNGVIRYVSEHKTDESSFKKYVQSGLKITIYLSLFSGFLLVFLSSYLSQWILLDAQYYYVFIFLGISLLFLSLNNFLLSILNGLQEFRKFVIINIITSIIGLLLTVFLVINFKLEGALIATVTYQSVVFFGTILFLKKIEWFSKAFLWGKMNREIVRKYFSYSLMAVVSAATVPVSQLLVRGHLIQKFTVENAGFWEGMNRISGLYLMLFTTSFSVYYLPKLSEIKTQNLLRKEILTTYKIITPIIIGSLLGIFLLKDLVINILFTSEFYPMKNLFFWQLLGDFFKIMSWILAFLMVAKSMTKMYIITEILFSLLLVGLSYYFIDKNGVIGATQSYCLNYFIYFVVMVIIFRKLLFKPHLKSAAL